MRLTPSTDDPRLLGAFAEHFVVCDFLRRGIEAYVVGGAGSPVDVIASRDSRLIRVQVKSTGSPCDKAPGGRPKLVYRFSMGKNSGQYATAVDLFAFVAIDTQEILYVDPTSFQGDCAGHKSFGTKKFLTEAPDSLDRWLSSWREAA